MSRKEVDGREVVKLKEMGQLILDRSLLLRQNFRKTKLVDFFLENNIDFFKVEDERNPYKNHSQAFFVDSVSVVEQTMFDMIEIYNIEGSLFKITRDDLKAETFEDKFYTCETAGIILANSLTSLLKKNDEMFEQNAYKFMRRNREKCNYVQLGKNLYFSKKEIDKKAEDLSKVISSRDAMKIVNERLNIDVKYRTFSAIVEKEGFISDIDIPFKSDWFLINKKDIEHIISFFDSRNSFNKSQTAYGKLQVYLSSVEKIKNNKIPETLKYFDRYCLEKSNKSKSNRPISLSTSFKEVYMVMMSRLTKEIYELDAEELEDLIKYASRYSDKTAKELRLIYNYIVEKKNMKEKTLPISRKKTKEVPAYPLEMYFEILAKIMNNLCNKTFIYALIGNRSLSSLVLYIYTHYISVWRRSDIIMELPNPNLKLIGFNTGEEFINWLREGNVFTEKMGKIICEDVEKKIYVYREKANKNDGDLLLFVSEYMYSTYGLLLAICEANRYVKTNTNGQTETLIAKGSIYTKKQQQLLPLIFDNADDIFDGGVFQNKRANKSFESYVAKKSEEWNIGIGYILASIFRGHKINANLIAEVTKIYITKDVNEASIRAFNMGIMSGVKYKLLEAVGVDVSGERKEIDKMVSEIKLTPIQTELTMKNLAEKSKIINEFLDRILTGNKDENEATLKELLYGKKSYGKHVYTRCLYRAYHNAREGKNEFISNHTKHCINANRDGCIGCPFLIAERFFLYEVDKRLSGVVYALNNAKEEIDKKIHFHRITTLYMPLIKEAYDELGMNQVESIVDVDRMMIAINKHIYLAR